MQTMKQLFFDLLENPHSLHVCDNFSTAWGSWELLCLHPGCSFMLSTQSRNTIPLEHVKNLHNRKKVVCCATIFHGLENWLVRMKFPMAFDISRDMELHNKLCAHFGSCKRDFKSVCQHCDCLTKHLTKPAKQAECHLWLPQDFRFVEDMFSPSCQNFFHDICFEEHPHKKHLASSEEWLHMHQLGAAE